MVGQNRIISQLNKLSANNFPKSLILSGERGCGKHTLCSLIEKKFQGYNFILFKDKISYEFIESCFLINLPTIYVIDADKLSVREQNVLLKLLEEPPRNINLILLTINTSRLLNTIVNRAVVWEFEKYTKDELYPFLRDNDESVLDLISTPGQLIELTAVSLRDMTHLCNLIIDRVNNASVSNTLSISKKFSFSNKEKDGFDIIIFMRLMRKILLERIKCESSLVIVNYYKITNDFYQKFLVEANNKSYLFNDYILSMKLGKNGD